MSATRYRLPDAMGGHEVEVIGTSIDLSLRVDVRVPNLGVVPIPQHLLIEVEPPLPPEPCSGRVYVVVDPPAGGAELFRRRDGLWWSVSEHQSEGLPWAQLHELGEVTVLVPDPAYDAPALPWRKPTTDERYPDLLVERSPFDGGVLELNGMSLAQNQIRELMGICARHLKPGAERDALQEAAFVRREVGQS